MAGTPFALAHTFAQTGPFRPANTVRGIDNAVLAGSSTVPGVGVPTALMSGRLAADRITGSRRPGPPRLRSAADRHDPLRTRRRRRARPGLRDAYRRCRALNAEHGRTFFLATRLLAPDQRPAVHALYGFARRADDILDDFDAALSVDAAHRTAAAAVHAILRPACPASGFRRRSRSCAAVAHTARRYGIPRELFDDFLASMRMDLTVTDYPDRAALEPVHARLGGSDRAADASRAGHRRPARRGRAVRGGAGKGVSAHQLPARRRRGSAARTGVPARRRTGRPRGRPRPADVVPRQPAHRRRGCGARSPSSTPSPGGVYDVRPQRHRHARRRGRGRASRPR